MKIMIKDNNINIKKIENYYINEEENNKIQNIS